MAKMQELAKDIPEDSPDLDSEWWIRTIKNGRVSGHQIEIAYQGKLYGYKCLWTQDYDSKLYTLTCHLFPDRKFQAMEFREAEAELTQEIFQLLKSLIDEGKPVPRCDDFPFVDYDG